jgi:hypothetical protein
MKFVIAAAAAAAFLIPAAASAQTAPAAPSSPATAAKYNLDTPIETLVADQKANAVLTANLGADVSKHEHYEMFKTMSLRQVQPMSGGAITEETLAKIEKELLAIK